MTKVIKVNKEQSSPQDFISMIKDKNILVYEDVQGSKICVRYNGSRFIIKPKSIKADELNFIDLTVQKFYNEAYFFFKNLPEYVKDLLNPDWWFVFEYFPDNQPGNVEYNRKPKNSLILTCIVKSNRYLYNINEIVEYSKLFNVDHIPILFYGKISSKQLEVINLFLNTSEKDLDYLFRETSFAKFFYDILNPNTTNSFLMDKDNFNDNIEKVIIKIEDDDEFSFEILNPMYKRNAVENSTDYSEVYSLILVNFLEFCQLVDFKKIKIKGYTKDDLYINLICKLFNDYVGDVKNDLINWEIEIPQFFKEEKFKINIDLLKNQKTIEYIKESPKLEYIFKVILGAFNKQRKKPIGIFNEQTVILFNQLVDDISNFINSQLKINKEYKFQKSDLLNFQDFFSLKSNVDGQGNIYPDLLDGLDKETGGEKKKKELPSSKKSSPIELKKENVSYKEYFLITEKLKSDIPIVDIIYCFLNNNDYGNLIGKVGENKYFTDKNYLIRLTDNIEEAEVCNFLINEDLDNVLNVYDVFEIKSDHIRGDSNLYIIVMENYEDLPDDYIDMTQSCIVSVSENNRVEEGNKCFDLFKDMMEIQNELEEKNIKLNEFNINNFGLKNDKLIFIDFSKTDGNKKSVEKVLTI